MSPMTANHLAYLALSVAITIFVGRTLHRHGRPFLIDVFRGDETLADAVNHLLLVGFYLLNIGLATWGVRYGGTATTLRESIDLVSTKIGWVLAILGVMHFTNAVVLCGIRRWKLAQPLEIVEFLDDPR
jgi:hypothetical protein